jgi:hypothetical protein
METFFLQTAWMVISLRMERFADSLSVSPGNVPGDIPERMHPLT